jgi:hypothetical protein
VRRAADCLACDGERKAVVEVENCLKKSPTKGRNVFIRTRMDIRMKSSCSRSNTARDTLGSPSRPVDDANAGHDANRRLCNIDPLKPQMMKSRSLSQWRK